MPVRFALARAFLHEVCAPICFDGLSLHENKDRHGGTFLCGSMDDGSLLGYLTFRDASRNNLDRFGFVACPKARSVVSSGVTRTCLCGRGELFAGASAPPSAHFSNGPGEG